jgi:mono/diheme cytochrome c family protein
MTPNRAKLFAAFLFILAVIAVTVFNSEPIGTVVHADDVADSYKSKCAMCHKPTAEKFFDPSKMDEVLVEVVLKGKKAEKPPNMPGYEEKGMTKEQAKLLVAYMRQMRTPPKE